MRILKQIIIENFQCHPKTVIDVAPKGLTVITGPTDHGKSAMVRAIKWLTTNRPQGDDFIRHGQTECKVTFEYTDNTKVIRRRTASLNQYYVNEDLFEGFGTGVPLEVQQATGIYVYEVADQTFYLNISEQLAGPFLGSSISAPLRAKILGKWAGTEEVDRANKKLGTDVYHAKQNKKRLEEDIFNLDAEVENYSWVKPLGKKLEKLEQIRDKVGKDSSKLELLKQKKKQLEQIDAGLVQIEERLEWYYDVLPDVSRIISGIEPDIPLMIDLIMKDNKLFDIENQVREQKTITNNAGQPEQALSQINDTNSKINQLENKEQQLQQVIKYHRQLVQADIEIGKNRAIVKKCGNPIEALKILNQCSNDINRSQKILDNWNILIDVREDIRILNEKSLQYQGIDKAKSILAELTAQLKNLSKLNLAQVLYAEKLDALNKISPNVELLKNAIKTAETEAEKAKKQYKEKLKGMGICPTCGNKVNNDCLENVI